MDKALIQNLEAYYETHIKNLRNEASRMFTLKVDAEDKVKKERSFEIARKCLDKKIKINDIIELTGLTKEEIENLE